MARHDSDEETSPQEQSKVTVTQSHGVSEYYLNIEATSESISGHGEMAILSYRQTPDHTHSD